MKRVTTQVAVLLCSVWAAGAYAAASMPLTFGVQGGANFANISTDPATTPTSRTGMTAGVNLELGLADYIYLQPELMYLQKGAVSGTVTTKLDYIELPIMGKAKFDAGMVKPYIMAGPSVAFAVSKTDSTGATLTNIKSLDFGLHFGGGMEIPVADAVSIFANGRYCMGLANIDDTAGSTLKTRGIVILAGAQFLL